MDLIRSTAYCIPFLYLSLTYIKCSTFIGSVIFWYKARSWLSHTLEKLSWACARTNWFFRIYLNSLIGLMLHWNSLNPSNAVSSFLHHMHAFQVLVKLHVTLSVPLSKEKIVPKLIYKIANFGRDRFVPNLLQWTRIGVFKVINCICECDKT